MSLLTVSSLMILPCLQENISTPGASLVVQCLRLHASTAGVAGSIPGLKTKILHATWPKKEKEKSSVINTVFHFLKNAHRTFEIWFLNPYLLLSSITCKPY